MTGVFADDTTNRARIEVLDPLLSLGTGDSRTLTGSTAVCRWYALSAEWLLMIPFICFSPHPGCLVPTSCGDRMF